ncbi:unnamed protein product [Paramecium sonneborni]|uniref:Uncharacterized protein n=1 Tax=Paramecium sonneborni TaxID=65129 RepID=A0A8S1NHP3_9CILI|nr:unnamed protein product [Paramecium sonneborni]
MKNIITIVKSNPIQYPSKDDALNWPSFNSNNASQFRQNLGMDKLNKYTIEKKIELENERNEIPEKLFKLSEQQQNFQHNNINKLLQKNENFWITKFIISDLIRVILLILSFIIPFSYIDTYKYNSTSLKRGMTISLIILEIVLVSLKLYSQSLKHQLIKISLKQILNLIFYTIFSIWEHTFIYGILSIYLFLRNFQIIGKFFKLFTLLDYQYIFNKFYRQQKYLKIIICIYFQLHLFSCMLEVEYFKQQQENISYFNSLYQSLLLSIFMKTEMETENKQLVILNITFNIGLIFYLLKQLLMSLNEISKYQQLLETYHLYFQSQFISTKCIIVLIHFSKNFEVLEQYQTQRQEQKINQIYDYLKNKLIVQELSRFEFLNEKTLEIIAQSGDLIQIEPLIKLKFDIDGLFIILTGKIQLFFLGLQIQYSNHKLIELSLTEIFHNQQNRIVRLEKNDSSKVLYFFIEKQKFIDIMKQSKEKETYQMIKDDVVLYNDTSQLNIRCYFCDQFHQSFACASFNIKRRFDYIQTYQDRNPRYSRKLNLKSRSAIYQQITHQGTSNNNIFEQSSDSFEVLVDHSNECVSLQNVGLDIMGQQPSKLLPIKEVMQGDIISDKQSEHSSTFLKSLAISPINIIRRPITSPVQHQASVKNTNQSFEIDQIEEYQKYKTKFNISNIIQQLNNSRY